MSAFDKLKAAEALKAQGWDGMLVAGGSMSVPYNDHDPESIEHVKDEFDAAVQDGWDAIVPSALTPDAQSRRNGIYVPLYEVKERIEALKKPAATPLGEK